MQCDGDSNLPLSLFTSVSTVLLEEGESIVIKGMAANLLFFSTQINIFYTRKFI